MKTNVYKLIVAGLLTAVGVLLPILFHTFSISGSIFLPMHIPVLLCGLICGGLYGGLCGLIVPLLSSLLTGMPPLYPVAVYMMCELIAYGVVAGALSRRFGRYGYLPALIISMLCGRAVLAAAQMVIFGLGADGFAFTTFWTSAFVTALPGIIIQLVLIPLVMYALSRSKLLPHQRYAGR